MVALAKALHYWDGHLTAAQQSLAGDGVWEAGDPDRGGRNPVRVRGGGGRGGERSAPAGLPTSPRRYVGWVGVETAGEEEAVWLLRAVLVEQVLARREERVLYLPVGATPSAGQAARVRRGPAGLGSMDSKFAASPCPVKRPTVPAALMSPSLTPSPNPARSTASATGRAS